MKIRIPSHPIHIAAFLLLTFLCYQAHQWVRHLVGAALCGGFGTMTFSVAIPREPCAAPVLVALSGPLFTYALAYIGMWLLRSNKRRLFAYALIFASFSHLRWIQTLTGRGDELVLAQQWLGVNSRIVVALVVFLLGLPPILAAYRVIANDHRLRVFLVSYLLPLPVLVLILFANRFLYGPEGNQVRGHVLLGIPPIVLTTDLLVVVLLLYFLRDLLGRKEEEA